ncbi:MAG: 16S rRNA (cytidine(1402)-2'-O)-methyltransferase [Pseudomonadota bacterium]
MNHTQIPLSAGLYLCAVPIGNLRDITLRVLDILASADLIAAEDTRTARKLMELHGVPLGDRKVVAYHDHSGDGVRTRLLADIRDGRSVAYVSEAGTPLIADPGYKLAAACHAQNLPVTAAPGASAVLSALTVSGLPSDAFVFAGFLPSSAQARRTALEGWRDAPATLIFYESPRRIHGMLGDVCEVMGKARPVVICRELTKKFEEVLRGPASEIRERIADRTLKGEIVVLIGAGDAQDWTDQAVQDALRDAMATMRVKDAANAVAGASGRTRRDVYQLALTMKDKSDGI